MNKRHIDKLLSDPIKLQKLLKTKPESFWQKRGERMALQLFHEMADRVPAYKDFLRINNVDPKKVKTMADFQQVPTIDKDNYLRKYDRKELCWDGDFAAQRWVISTTSGSTGEPFYFPRTDLQDEYYATTAELYLRENFQIQDKKTLYIDAFAMGAWIGGLFTYEAIHRVAQKGYALSIITPGINKAEVINNVRKLGPDFDQVIIGSYPPMLRDIIDFGIEEGLDWKNYNIGLVFSAEGFGEEFRDHVAKKAGLADIYSSSLNHYGTVDLGTMSHETPVSVTVRRHAVEDKKLFTSLFGTNLKQPTFTQYIPEMFYFESANGRLVCSSYSGLPLVRYDLKDNGDITSLESVSSAYKSAGRNFETDLATANVLTKKWNLPFVYVYERSDFSVNLIGGVVYPEEIRRALLTKALHSHLTAKFTMEVVYDKRMNPKLVIHLELRRGIAKPERTFSRKVQKIIVDTLLEHNTEYQSNYASYGRKLWPRIIFWPYEHPQYFSGRGKQKWVKKG